PAGGREADIGNAFAQGNLGAAHKAGTDHAAHGTAYEVELEGTAHQGHALQRTLHDHQRVLLAGQLLRGHQTVRVLPGVAELDLVDRLQLSVSFIATVSVD